MRNKIRVETEEDSLYLADDKIHAIADSEEHIYELSSVNKILVLTTDKGPFYDDMCLAVEVGDDDVVFIMSEHRCYKSFLFDQIGKALPIDYEKIIEASACTENCMFEIYTK